MTGGTRDTPVNSSPAVAANAEGEEIEVLESTDVLPVAQEDVSVHTTRTDLKYTNDYSVIFNISSIILTGSGCPSVTPYQFHIGVI